VSFCSVTAQIVDKTGTF